MILKNRISNLQKGPTLSGLADANKAAKDEKPNISMTWNMTITRMFSFLHPSGIVSGKTLPKKLPFFSQSIMIGTRDMSECATMEEISCCSYRGSAMIDVISLSRSEQSLARHETSMSSSF
jgi:hypothetical protein